MASEPKRARTQLTYGEKRQICKHIGQHPTQTKAETAEYFSNLWKKSIGRTTIGDIVREKEKWLNVPLDSSDSVRNRSPMFSQLEECLFTWFSQKLSQNATISDEILRQKGKFFGEQLGISGFVYSSGWLSNFKKRYGISRHKIFGESQGNDMKAVVSGREELRKQLEKYDPDNLFNFDETGLFYRLPPNSTLATRPVHGCKRQKDRLTIGLLTNATGSYKPKPVVIAKAARPRCFGKTFDPNLLVRYFSNSNAWMTSKEFHAFLTSLDREMHAKKKSILLLVDNCSSHFVTCQLTNVQLHFLPPNTTAHLQPLDNGIIQSFKTQYRKLLVSHYIHCLDENESMNINVKQALYFIRDAWNTVSESTISACWTHTGK